MQEAFQTFWNGTYSLHIGIRYYDKYWCCVPFVFIKRRGKTKSLNFQSHFHWNSSPVLREKTFLRTGENTRTEKDKRKKNAKTANVFRYLRPLAWCYNFKLYCTLSYKKSGWNHLGKKWDSIQSWSGFKKII